jgi:hypothetical protein
MAYIETVVIDQAGAGTTTLRASEASPWRIEIINYVVVLSADGTFAFSDGTDWLSGDMTIAAKGGVSARGSKDDPLMIGGVGRPLQITTVGGAATGHVLIRLR